MVPTASGGISSLGSVFESTPIAGGTYVYNLVYSFQRGSTDAAGESLRNDIRRWIVLQRVRNCV